eukprot:m.103680 g.103680  ORF g.103680 m.103680 type:complete len:84 (+) comp15052_c0_seq5:66-317(+)
MDSRACTGTDTGGDHSAQRSTINNNNNDPQSTDAGKPLHEQRRQDDQLGCIKTDKTTGRDSQAMRDHGERREDDEDDGDDGER